MWRNQVRDKLLNTRNCEISCSKDEHENCSILGADGLPVQCVGSWVEDKYFFLEKYLNASCEVRRQFADKGNAVFIDLFSGPGRCVLRGENKEIDSGGLRASLREEALFNEFYFCDKHSVNLNAFKKRVNKDLNCFFKCGDANEAVASLARKLLRSPYKYHFAFIDPFGPDGLKFTTLAELARLQRMDMLIHFPIGSIKRNIPKWLKSGGKILDDYLGTDIWRDKINKSPVDVYKILIEIFKDQLMKIDYPKDGLNLVQSENVYTGLPVVSVKNTQNVDLYVLILASKHGLGQKIWNSVIRYNPDGQRTFNF